MKIYVCEICGGRWEDSWQFNVIAFKTQLEAKEWVKQKEDAFEKMTLKEKQKIDSMNEKDDYCTVYSYEEIELKE